MTFVIALDVPRAPEEVDLPDLAGYGASTTVTKSSGSSGLQLAQLIIEGTDAVLAPVAAIVAAWIGARHGRGEPRAEETDDEFEQVVTGRLIFPGGRRLELSGRPKDVAAMLASIDKHSAD